MLKTMRNIVYPLVGYMIVLFPRLMLNLIAVPVRTITDEVTTISGAAFGAGLDWSQVIATSPYYGFGFTVLISPIFMLTDDPYVIYRCMLIFCSLIQSMIYIICYYTVRKYFNIVSQKSAMLISILCSYFVATRTMIVYNEHMLILLSWVIMLLILKLTSYTCDNRRKLLYSFLLCIILAYSLTVHERAIIYWLSLGCLIVVFLFLEKKIMLSWKALVFAIFAYFGIEKLVEYIQNKNWLLQGGQILGNTQINISGKFSLLMEQEGRFAWLSTIVGQINTISVFSGGIITVSIIILIRYAVYFMHNKEINKEDLKYVYILIYFGAAVLATILAQSITWLPKTTEVIEAGFQNDLYGTKGFTYIRYFAPYCGPIMMVVMCFLYNKQKEYLKIQKMNLLFIIMLQIYWLVYIVPFMENNLTQIGGFEVYFPLSKYTKEMDISISALLPATIIMLDIFLIISILVKNNKINYVYIILSIFLIYQYIFNAIYWDNYTQKYNYDKTNASYELIKAIEKEVDLPYKLYVIDSRKNVTNHFSYLQYQFMFNKYKIIPNKPSDLEKEAIVFINCLNDEMEWKQNGYMLYKLDENETIMIKGKRLQNEISNYVNK